MSAVRAFTCPGYSASAAATALCVYFMYPRVRIYPALADALSAAAAAVVYARALAIRQCDTEDARGGEKRAGLLGKRMEFRASLYQLVPRPLVCLRPIPHDGL